MADFQAALRRGLQAYKEQERGRLEVQEVLREFKRQIYFVTERQVVLLELPAEDGSGFTRLIASHPGNKAPSLQLEVCAYAHPPTGYPVRLRSVGWTMECLDKSQLEHALARVLEEPTNAGRILEVQTQKEAASAAPSVGLEAPLPAGEAAR